MIISIVELLSTASRNGTSGSKDLPSERALRGGIKGHLGRP
jgi:hypothetical protein